MSSGTAFRKYRTQMARAAKDLMYGQDVVERIKCAKTESEITTIMTKARKAQR